MEEGYYNDLAEGVHQVADNIHDFKQFPTRGHIADRLRELAGIDTRDGSDG